jgi:hypothetical protein
MSTRQRTAWKLRSDQQYDCRVGRKTNSRGKSDQQRFRLGGDLREAQRRDGLLRQIWNRIERLQPSQPTWTDDTLDLAREVARGQSVIQVPRRSGEEDVPYAQRVHWLRTCFPMLALVPEPHYGAAFGIQLLSAMDRMYASATEESIAAQQAEGVALLGELLKNNSLPAVGPTLHQAMEAYIQWLKKEYQHPEVEITGWGRTQIKQVESLKAHHRNQALKQLDQAAVEQMLQYWRQRPYKQGTKPGVKQRVTHKSSLNYLKTMRRFFKWLHGRKEFGWRKPENFFEMGTNVVTLEQEERAQITPEKVFTLAELVLLFKYGQPLDRLLILLGINCGFSIAESATLRVGEIHLRTPHSPRHREVLNFESTAADSFIKRKRRKNKVYGEFWLFNITVQGMEWALRQRKKHANFGSEARLLLNGKGEPFDKPTAGGNANRQFANSFARLLDRIEDDGNQITRLPFKMLRKTGGDLVKRFSDGEVMGVFHSRGRVEATKDNLDDLYANRPFGKVFRALQQVEKYLQPMFEAAGSDPFTKPPEAYTSRKTVDCILQLYREGAAPSEIAEKVGRSQSCVQRHISRAIGPRKTGRPRKPR